MPAVHGSGLVAFGQPLIGHPAGTTVLSVGVGTPSRTVRCGLCAGPISQTLQCHPGTSGSPCYQGFDQLGCMKAALNAWSLSLTGIASAAPLLLTIVVAVPLVSTGCPPVAKAVMSSKYTAPNRA